MKQFSKQATTLLLGAGMFMEPSAIMLIFAPILFPVAVRLGVDPVHFGILMMSIVTLGGMTWPSGSAMFAVCALMDVTIEEYSIESIPFIAAVMRDVFEVTPPLLKESAYGLGATTWEVVSTIVLPYTKAGVIGGIMLGLGRALGETMAVTFVIGNMNQLDSLSLFQAANSITSALANEFAEAGEGLHQASLIYLGLVLFFITFVVLSLSKVLLAQLRKGEGKKS